MTSDTAVFSRLSRRMRALEQLVSPCNVLADVGCDHGFLAICFVQTKRAERAIAMDVRPGPLERAREHVERYGCGDRIALRLSDGLEALNPGEADAILIAGMGGETIMGILERAPWTLGGARLVLQPQSKLDELCLWLHSRGYGIRDAAVAAEGRRLYIAMLCEAGSSDSLYSEDALFARGDPLLPDWVKARSQRIERALDGILRSSSGQSEVEDAKATLERLRRYTKEEQHDHR